MKETILRFENEELKKQIKEVEEERNTWTILFFELFILIVVSRFFI